MSGFSADFAELEDKQILRFAQDDTITLCETCESFPFPRPPAQNSSRSANWICRSRFDVSKMRPALPLMLAPVKITVSGVRKFA